MKKFLGLLAVSIICSSAAIAQTIGPPSSTAPSGTAGGDLTGTYPNPTLAWISHVSGKTLAINNSLTFSGNDGATLNIGAGGTVGPFTVDTTTVTGGTGNGLIYNKAGIVGNLATANSGVLVTSPGGVPSISATLPSGLTIPGFAPLASPTFTGVVSVAAGSAGTPSLAVGNATTGLFSVSTTGFGISVNGTQVIDYGITAGGIWQIAGTSVRISNGLTVQGGGVAIATNTSTSAGLYNRVASGTAPTVLPNQTASNAGLSASSAGNTTIVASNGTGGSGINVLDAAYNLVTVSQPIKFASSTTGVGLQTFTNSPCVTLSTEQYIPVQITGQTGTWYVAACQ